jgi:hypothetical protein
VPPRSLQLLWPSSNPLFQLMHLRVSLNMNMMRLTLTMTQDRRQRVIMSPRLWSKRLRNLQSGCDPVVCRVLPGTTGEPLSTAML